MNPRAGPRGALRESDGRHIEASCAGNGVTLGKQDNEEVVPIRPRPKGPKASVFIGPVRGFLPRSGADRGERSPLPAPPPGTELSGVSFFTGIFQRRAAPAGGPGGY